MMKQAGPYSLPFMICCGFLILVGCNLESNQGDSPTEAVLENNSNAVNQSIQVLSSEEDPRTKWKARFFIVDKNDTSHYLDSTPYKAKGTNRIKVTEKARNKCLDALADFIKEDPETFSDGICDQQPPQAKSNEGTDTSFSCISDVVGETNGYCKGTRKTCDFPPKTYQVHDEPGPNCTFSPGRNYWRDGKDSVTVDGCCQYHATIKYHLW